MSRLTHSNTSFFGVKMNKKYSFLLILFLGIIILSINQVNYSSSCSSNNTTLVVSGLKISSVEKLVEEITNEPYFEGYNQSTVEWLYTIGENQVFFSNEYYVVMNSSDANKLPTEDSTDVFINDTFSCEIIENHSLGNNYPDILYVKDVEFLNQTIEYIEV